MQSNFRLWTRVGEERELLPKDFAGRTAIKPVAPCRGDFCADIFSVSSFVPHRGSRLSLFFSLFRSRVLSLFPFSFSLAVVAVNPRSLSISFSSSVCQFVFVFLFPLWSHIATASFRGHEIATASEESEDRSIRAQRGYSRKSRNHPSRLLVRL